MTEQEQAAARRGQQQGTSAQPQAIQIDPSQLNIFAQLQPDRINLSQAVLAQNLMHFIQIGSQRGSLQYSDIQIVMLAGDDINRVTATKLFKNGSRLIDIQLFLANDRTDRVTILNEKPESTIIMDKTQLAQAVFSLYFVLITQAHPPSNRPIQQEVPNPLGGTENRTLRQKTNMAQFLVLFLGLNNQVFDLVEQLASFSLERMDHSWIRTINIIELSGAFKNRTVLGIAGTRMLQALADCTGYFFEYPERGLERRIKVLIIHIQNQLYFSFHPFFRTPEFVAKFRSLNSEIEDIISRYVYPIYIQSLVDTKRLYRYPRIQGQPALLRNVSIPNINEYRRQQDLIKVSANEVARPLTEDMLNFDLINTQLYQTFLNTTRAQRNPEQQQPNVVVPPVRNLDEPITPEVVPDRVVDPIDQADPISSVIGDVDPNEDETRAL